MDSSLEEAPSTEDDLLAWVRLRLPLHGTVTRVPGLQAKHFYYLRLPVEWEEAKPILVQAFQRISQYEPSTISSGQALLKSLGRSRDDPKKLCTFFDFPSTVGLHISIEHGRLDECVSFSVEGIMSYTVQKIGEPSTFDSSKLCARYFALRLRLDDAKSIKLSKSTHVSIAAYGLIQP